MSSPKTKKKMKYADPVTGTFVEADMQVSEETAKQYENDWLATQCKEPSAIIKVVDATDLPAAQAELAQKTAHKLPDGMNRNNSVQDFLMVIIEELWRIEDMLHDKAKR